MTAVNPIVWTLIAVGVAVVILGLLMVAASRRWFR